MLFQVSSLPNAGVAARPVVLPGYTRADIYQGWRPNERLVAAGGVQNAFDPSHVEFISWAGHMAEVPRNAYVRVTWMLE